MKKSETNIITLTAMMVAMVIGATYIGIPNPLSFGGYMHLGTLVTFAIAIKYGKKMGMLSGGIGAALFDIFSPYAIWWPGTLITRLIMGYVVGKISEDSKGQGANNPKNYIAIGVGGVILITGYFLYQAVFLSYMPGSDPEFATFGAAALSIPGNTIQILIGLFAVNLIKYLPDVEIKN
jgi:uncharacterized membrane protein